MVKVNQHFLQLQNNYLFSEIARRVHIFRQKHPQSSVISLGIGDVTRPLVPAVIEALQQAVKEMGQMATFHGYGPEQGYTFLRTCIAEQSYAARGVCIEPDEIFISDGAKSDLGNFQELFAPDSLIAVTDPVYPVYVDSNVMAGRAGYFDGTRWSRIIYLPCTQENNFVPRFPHLRPDLIYLCSPNNPTGMAMSREVLQTWVNYAREQNCLILYDSAYEAFITEPDLPHTIYEIEGAREVAVEFRSFSKTAGFTGLRCAYTVVPQDLSVADGKGGSVHLHGLWNRRQATKYNGCPYIVQRAAEAVYSPAGQVQIAADLAVYQHNAHLLITALQKMGLSVFGGKNAPYLWVTVPSGMSSWSFFDYLLDNVALVCTPGVGFGASGEGYVRLTAFATPQNTELAIQRLADCHF